jgi:hypothetical protein
MALVVHLELLLLWAAEQAEHTWVMVSLADLAEVVVKAVPHLVAVELLDKATPEAVNVMP